MTFRMRQGIVFRNPAYYAGHALRFATGRSGKDLELPNPFVNETIL
ncbi:MAG: hypothetical protein K5989_06500 [Lachnospiraceae bacterium]|nr:hypothetical protein [Lachnospiraceae bacterium]